jgi:hypothetical protein
MRMGTPETFCDVIALWESHHAFGADIGVEGKLVAVWKHRDSIPPEYWPRTEAAAIRRGFAVVTLALLNRIYASNRGVRGEAESPSSSDAETAESHSGPSGNSCASALNQNVNDPLPGHPSEEEAAA